MEINFKHNSMRQLVRIVDSEWVLIVINKFYTEFHTLHARLSAHSTMIVMVLLNGWRQNTFCVHRIIDVHVEIAIYKWIT